MSESQNDHNQIVREQFTRQAIPFTRIKGHLDSIQLLLDLTRVTPDDTVLDVGCGPGIVACEFARIATHVTGIDLTEAMIEQATVRQAEMDLSNLQWETGSATPLPYPDATYTIVLSRYTFHHFDDPEKVLAEIIRVCRPGGRILVADPVLPPEHIEAFNSMERLRDPSHTRALSTDEFQSLIAHSGLTGIRIATYPVDVDLETQLAASSPREGDAEKLRALFRRDLQEQTLGTRTRLIHNQIHYTYPITVAVGTHPDTPNP